jgi:hypothetical protein
MSTNIIAFLLITSCRKGTSFDFLVKKFIKLHQKLKDLNKSFGFSFDNPNEVVNYSLNLLDKCIQIVDTKNGIKIIKPKLYEDLFEISQSIVNYLFVEAIIGNTLT